MKFRHEKKHIVNFADVLLLRQRLGTVFEHDKHATNDGTYMIKSLYFDNFNDKALREKADGLGRREKFRIRYYGNDTSFIRLEKKSKINDLCNKESVNITREECEKIIRGDTAFMAKDERELVRELYAKMHFEALRPKCIVRYRRESFVYPPGNVRVTIDTDISGSFNVEEFFNPNLFAAKFYKETVLEVKWDEYLPDIAAKCVYLASRRSSAFSKYAAVRIY